VENSEQKTDLQNIFYLLLHLKNSMR